MIIHTICKYGECLPPEVQKGIALTECDVMVISSESKNDSHGLDRKNIFNNWHNAMMYMDGDIFIGMDSDIVLKRDSVKFLLAALDGVSFSYYPTNILNTHGIWAVRKEALENIDFVYTKDKCPICNFRERLVKAGYKNRIISGTLKSVDRITKQRSPKCHK